MASKKSQGRARTRLYLITPPQVDSTKFAPLLDKVLAAGDVACLQLRLKNTDNQAADEALIAKAIAQLMPVAHRHDVAFILNDNPELAAKYDCDGVHIGQDDMACAAARAIVGDDKITGVTCHDSKHLAMEAGESGADYVAFGAFYETHTKDAKTRASPDLLRFWQEFVELPCVAIGGITPHNAAPLVAAGADFIAASSSVWRHGDGPAAAVRAFNEIFDAAHEN
ncbi:MAG TPA: thiamine phosphate synthase [Rhodobiaceae bacterium]|nr:thiamine phosphate synthase [Rhodobiaceae bacterium]